MGCIKIDIERCKACEICVANCPQKLIIIDPETLNLQGYNAAKLVDPEGKCKACKICADMCPDVCIDVYK